MTDLLDRLRAAHADSPQRIAGSNILAEAADRMAALEAEAKHLQAKLTECCLQALATDGEAGEALDRAIKAEAEVARLRDALQPFAKEAEQWETYEDCELLVESFPHYYGEVNVGDLRRARAALGDASAQQTPAALNRGDAT